MNASPCILPAIIRTSMQKLMSLDMITAAISEWGKQLRLLCLVSLCNLKRYPAQICYLSYFKEQLFRDIN